MSSYHFMLYGIDIEMTLYSAVLVMHPPLKLQFCKMEKCHHMSIIYSEILVVQSTFKMFATTNVAQIPGVPFTDATVGQKFNHILQLSKLLLCVCGVFGHYIWTYIFVLNCNFSGFITPSLLACFGTFGASLLKLHCLAKDHWWGFNTRNAQMVHIVN